MGEYLACFKAYDVRGRVPEELSVELAYDIGRAYADETGAKRVVVGHDIRLTGPAIADSFAKGLTDAGVDVANMGLVGTEMVYFATAHYGFDGGVMVTASHNPPEYNGLKMVREGSRPISGDTGLYEIERRTHEKKFERTGAGTVAPLDAYDDYVQHLLSFVDASQLKGLRIAMDVGNGAAGVALEKLLKHLPIEVERMAFEPDGNFPHGVPNPILPESRKRLEDEVRRAHEAGDPYDFGVAWDGDYDRCFLLDGTGRFIEGYYIVGLLAQSILDQAPGSKIIYDPRLTWNTLDVVAQAGGEPVMCKSGHAFIKEKMRAVDAAYGGEMSAHHYFRDFWFCDSGMLPWLLIAQLVRSSGKSLEELVSAMIEAYPCSGEINSRVEDVASTLASVEDRYSDGEIDKTDGLSVAYKSWRFNLRGSNTEPVIRLNVESRNDSALLKAKTEEILKIVRGS